MRGHDHHHDGDAPPGHWRRLGHRLRHDLGHRLRPHAHGSADRVDAAMESTRDGLFALWISLAVLGATAAVQLAIVAVSGSAALLGDTMHNVADALTAVPLAIAFLVGRRAANRRYTYGYGRAEDLAGIVIVGVIAASAVAAGVTAVARLLHPAQVTHLPWVAAAGLVGFAGNELVARYRILVGRRIGSAALVADGLHARTDGFASLAVVAAAAGGWLGWDLVDAAEATLRAVDGVRDVASVRLRWIGHHLHAEAEVVVDAGLSLLAAHEVVADAEHQLTHTVPGLVAATVHADPASHPGRGHHADLSHRRRPARNQRPGWS